MHSRETQTRALELYAETFSTYKAADRMALEGTEVHPDSISRWAREVDGLTGRMRQEQKDKLADTWFEVAQVGADRMVSVIETLPDNQVAVPAAIATDKALKLTEETPTHQGSRITVLVGVKVD
ncbi:hypothetical protein LCGC14_1671900 [marine sediment metagenome]|uniref:Uncharacterized protein n=1 Tax=marine sediment metagenome TaxID=412755 RepID=A0A0F9KQX7_9ZZZZ